MASLEELRLQLDEIDDQMVRLYEERMKVCAQVGEYKIKNGKKVLDRQREKNKLQAVSEKASSEFNKKGVRELYEQLMSMSRKLQYQQLVKAGALGRLPFIEMESLDAKNARIVFPGTEGAYSQAAIQKIILVKIAIVFMCGHSVKQWKRSKMGQRLCRAAN